MFEGHNNSLKDTIYAPACGTQKSGVIIVRISGPKVKEVIKTMCRKDLLPRYATLCDVYHSSRNQLIDKAIVIFYESPHSFTNEDVLELHLHGSTVVLKLTLQALSQIKGLRFAGPGEFSLRSFMNGKMDLTQAEGLADLIDAETEAQHAQSLKQMSGALKEIYENWRQKLLKILSNLEASIDFPDDDIPDNITYNLFKDANALYEEIKNHLADDQQGEKLREGMYVAILGPINAGKSSLINRIAKRDVAIVSQIAGTTRDVIEIHLNLKGYPILVADTAGLRESSDALENIGIKKSLERANMADLKIIVLDGSTYKTMPQQISKLIDQRTILIFNKTDISSTNYEDSSAFCVLHISTKENIGIDYVMDKISIFAESFFGRPGVNPLITRQRYRDNLINASKCLADFVAQVDPVLGAEDLRMASHYLGKIVGKIDVEAVLGEIFSSFCIGK